MEYGCHLGRLRRRRAYVLTSNAASHDNHEKTNSWATYVGMGLFLVALRGSSAMTFTENGRAFTNTGGSDRN